MTKTIAKKAKTTAPKAKANGEKKAGYKGHRVGSIKEKLHLIFDKLGKTDLDKAKAEAAKTGASAGTINTSFSQFRNNA